MHVFCGDNAHDSLALETMRYLVFLAVLSGMATVQCWAQTAIDYSVLSQPVYANKLNLSDQQRSEVAKILAQRVTDLAREAKLPVGVVINRATPEIEEELTAALDGSDILGCLPDSRTVFRSNLKGEPLDPEMPEIETVCKAILEVGA